MTNRVRGSSLRQNKMHGRSGMPDATVAASAFRSDARRYDARGRRRGGRRRVCRLVSAASVAQGRLHDVSCWRRPAMSAAPGTGTAIPARAAISRPSTTATPSIPIWRARGNGRRNTPPNPKSCAISASSPTAMICGATSALAPGSRRRIGTRPPNAGCSRPTMARPSPAALTSWPPAVSPRQSRRRSTASRISRARSISPAAGRTRRSSSPASASRSSARDRPGSSRFR